MVGLRWMVGLHDASLNGILADEMVSQGHPGLVHCTPFRKPGSLDACACVLCRAWARPSRYVPCLLMPMHEEGSATGHGTECLARAQVISLIAYLVEARQEERPFLVAVPASVLPNWQKEFSHWAPELHVVAYKGDPGTREAIFDRQVCSRTTAAA